VQADQRLAGKHLKLLIEAHAYLDRLGGDVFFAYLSCAVTSGEIGRTGRRRRSNRPGNSQAKGPCDVDTSGKRHRRAVAPDVPADGIILSGTATDGAFGIFEGITP
jgi:hypothetical protein